MEFLFNAFERLCESDADKAARARRERAAEAKARGAKVSPVLEHMVPGKDGVTVNTVLFPGPGNDKTGL